MVFFRGKWSHLARVVWLKEKGEIPPNLVVCHLCDNPNCISVKHLFLGTLGDNNRDRAKKGRSASRANGNHPCALKTHCVHGHEYTEKNTVWRQTRYGIQRVCRVCKNASKARWKKKQNLGSIV